MARNAPIPNLVGGVSKLPPNQRVINECSEQINYVSSLNNGLTIRPGSYLEKQIFKRKNLSMSKEIKISDKEYLFQVFEVSDNLPNTTYEYKLFDLQDYSELTISFPDSQTETDFRDYMGINDKTIQDKNIGILQVNDAIFFYNKKKIVKINNNTKTSNNTSLLLVNSSMNKQEEYVYDISYTKNGEAFNRVSKFFFRAENSYGNSYSKPWITDTSRQSLARVLCSFQTHIEIEQYFYMNDNNLFPNPGSTITDPENRWAIYDDVLTFNNGYSYPADFSVWNRNSGNASSAVTATIVADLHPDFENDDYSFERVTFTVAIPSVPNNTQVSISLPSGYDKIMSVKEVTLDNPMNAYCIIGGKFDYNYGNGAVSGFNFFGMNMYPNQLDKKCLVDILPSNDQVIITEYEPNAILINNISVANSSVKAVLNNGTSSFPQIESFQDLPNPFYNGNIFEITQGTNTIDDNINVEFKTNNGVNFGSGEWIETTTENTFYDKTTMPFTAIFNGVDLLINSGGWQEMEAGNLSNNEKPYFIDNTIDEMFVFGNRLSLLTSDDKVVMSQSGNFFNFWRTTVSQILPTDRINIVINTDKKISLKYAVPWNQGILLIDDNTQFLMYYNEYISIDTLQIKEISNFNSSGMKPINGNNEIFFISDYADNTMVTSFFSKDIQLVDGNNLTNTIEEYIPNGIDFYGINSSKDMLFLGKKGSNIIYLYSFNKYQNEVYDSWSKIIIDISDNEKIVDMKVINDKIILTSEVLLGTVNEENNPDFYSIKYYSINLTKLNNFERDGFLNKFKIHLDSKVVPTISSINGTEVTLDIGFDILNSFSFPPQYPTINTDRLRVVNLGKDTVIGNKSIYAYGHSYDIINFYSQFELRDPNIGSGRYSYIVIDVPKLNDPDYTLGDLLVGLTFDAEYEFTPYVVRDRNNLPLQSGTTQITGLNLRFNNTGGFKLITDIPSSGEYTDIYYGKILGGQNNVLGEVVLESGSENFYIGSDRDELTMKIKNLDFLPQQIYYAEIEYEYESITGR